MLCRNGPTWFLKCIALLLLSACLWTGFQANVASRKHPLIGTSVGAAETAAELQCSTLHTGCARALLEVVNQDREAHGAPPLTLSWTQSHCSKPHSIHMAAEGYISHDQFPADVCIPWRSVAENVGASWSSDEWGNLAAINAQMLSEPWQPGCTGSHVCSLRSTLYTTIGIGVYRQASGATWLTEDFTNG